MSNNRVGLQLVEVHPTGGDPVVAIATVNIPEIPLESDEVIIKDYSENEGMLKALLTAGIVAEPHRFVGSGFVTMPVCRLLI